MKTSDRRPRPEYSQVREAFARLDVQDKAAFVLEATFDTFGQAVRDAGQRVAETFEAVGREDFFDDFFGRPEGAHDADPDIPGAAEPPTAKKRAKKTTKPKAPRGKAGGSKTDDA